MKLNELDVAFFKQVRESGTLRMEMNLRDKVERLQKALQDIMLHPRTKETADIVRNALLPNTQGQARREV
jgi:hypothetical protein